MTDLEYFRRRLADLIVSGNRLQIDLAGDESRIMSDALIKLVDADVTVGKIKTLRMDKTFGGGS